MNLGLILPKNTSIGCDIQIFAILGFELSCRRSRCQPFAIHNNNAIRSVKVNDYCDKVALVDAYAKAKVRPFFLGLESSALAT